jgi:hypothetical protein
MKIILSLRLLNMIWAATIPPIVGGLMFDGFAYAKLRG